MIVGAKVVYRGSAQTWSGLVPGARHYLGVLENTETGASVQSAPLDTEREALRWVADRWTVTCSPRSTLLFLGASQGDMCVI